MDPYIKDFYLGIELNFIELVILLCVLVHVCACFFVSFLKYLFMCYFLLCRLFVWNFFMLLITSACWCFLAVFSLLQVQAGWKPTIYICRWLCPQVAYCITPHRFWHHGRGRQVWECFLCPTAPRCIRRYRRDKIEWEQGKLNGPPNKLVEIVQFHMGDVIACLQKASLIPGGRECIIYRTVMGSLGALLAFTSREDVDFFSHLEIHEAKTSTIVW